MQIIASVFSWFLMTKVCPAEQRFFAAEFSPLFSFIFVVINLAPIMIHQIFRHICVGLVQRESLKKGAIKYLQSMLPVYTSVSILQLCIWMAVAAHCHCFPTLILLPQAGTSVARAKLFSGVCTNVNASFVRAHCVESPSYFTFVDMDSRAPSGHGFLRCTDNSYSAEIGAYRSLFYMCRDTKYSMEVVYSFAWDFCSIAMVAAMLFREYVISIDDQMTVWNWVSRAKSWEARTGTARGTAAWSAHRIIAAIALALGGFGGMVLVAVMTTVCALMRNARGISSVGSGFTVILTGCWMTAFGLLLFQFRHRRLYALELSPEDNREALQQENLLIEDETLSETCGFWFLRSDWIREYEGETLPRYQELKQLRQSPLERIVIRRAEAYTQSLSLSQKFCCVSHRWLDHVEPDVGGVHLEQLRKHLNEQPGRKIGYVWYDFSFMPQHGLNGDDRTAAEKASFTWMLRNINMLYLSGSVLVMIDLSYASRF